MTQTDAFTIRTYRPADRDAVLALNAYGLAAAGIDVDDDFYQGEDFTTLDNTYSETTGGVLLVGEIHGRIMAMGGIRRLDTDTCELLRMRVHPEHQGCGYGRVILERLEREARCLGYSRVQLLTGEDQHPAVGLYGRHGYRVTHREILIGIPSVHMAKNLKPPDETGRVPANRS